MHRIRLDREIVGLDLVGPRQRLVGRGGGGAVDRLHGGIGAGAHEQLLRRQRQQRVRAQILAELVLRRFRRVERDGRRVIQVRRQPRGAAVDRDRRRDQRDEAGFAVGCRLEDVVGPLLLQRGAGRDDPGRCRRGRIRRCRDAGQRALDGRAQAAGCGIAGGRCRPRRGARAAAGRPAGRRAPTGIRDLGVGDGGQPAGGRRQQCRAPGTAARRRRGQGCVPARRRLRQPRAGKVPGPGPRSSFGSPFGSPFTRPVLACRRHGGS
jgi:hypothetical protein